MSEAASLRKIRNLIEARKLLDRWERSGEPFGVWCRQQGISYRSLAAYKRYRHPPSPTDEKTDDAAIQFVELQLDPASPPTARYAIRLPNGRAIECDAAFQDGHIQRLLALVETC